MSKIIAVDFDGTIVENRFPDIGEPIEDAISTLLKFKQDGHELILFTCREGPHLWRAIKFCKQQGLEFDAVNTALHRFTDNAGGLRDTRKPFAHYYIDDRNIGGLPSWKEIEKLVKNNGRVT